MPVWQDCCIGIDACANIGCWKAMVGCWRGCCMGVPCQVCCWKTGPGCCGNMGCMTRGVMESVFFFYALTFYVSTFTVPSLVLGLIIFMVYTARALTGDIRDYRHNRKSGKKTIPVVYGINQSKNVIMIILLLSAIIQIAYFNSFVIAIPLILFAVSMLFFSNGYVLHQLMIFTTMFFHINMIYKLT